MRRYQLDICNYTVHSTYSRARVSDAHAPMVRVEALASTYQPDQMFAPSRARTLGVKGCEPITVREIAFAVW